MDVWVPKLAPQKKNQEKAGVGASHEPDAKMGLGELCRLPMESCQVIGGDIDHGGLFGGYWGL